MKVPRHKVAECVSRNRVLAATLTAVRKQTGMTQRQLAERLARVHSFVARVEGGTQLLKVWELVDYAHALCVDPSDLIRQISISGNAPRDAKQIEANQAKLRKDA